MTGQIPILILAAGAARRMRGADKLLQDVAGEPLLRVQVMRAAAVPAPVFVALPSLAHPRAAAIAGTGAQVIVVPDAAEGLSATMRGAVAQMPDAPAFMLVLADLVALTTADLRAVLAARAAAPDHLIWRGATAAGAPGHPIVFDARLRPAFATLTGDTGGDAIVRPLRHRTHLVVLPDDHARLDLDTPEDWAAWRAVFGGGQITPPE